MGKDIGIRGDRDIVLACFRKGGKLSLPQCPLIPFPGLDTIGQGIEGELLVGVGGYSPDAEGVLDDHAQGGAGPDIRFPVPGEVLEDCLRALGGNALVIS